MESESCPKCKASSIHLYSLQTASWIPRANTCFSCGFRHELVMHSTQSRERMEKVMQKNSKSFKDCAGGCGARIAINTTSDLCRKCRGKKY